jgi:chromosome partitioning protein
MGFRWLEGFAERLVYREFFPRGLTALDDLDKVTLGMRPSRSHVTAREEVIALLNALHLPLSEHGKRHAAALAQWYSVMQSRGSFTRSSLKCCCSNDAECPADLAYYCFS